MDKSKSISLITMQKQILAITIISILTISVLSQDASASILSASTKNAQANADLLTLNNTSGTHLWWVSNNGQMTAAQPSNFQNDLLIANNKITSTSYNIWESGTQLFSEFKSGVGGSPNFIYRPSSSGADVKFYFSRLNDIVTNTEYILFQSNGGSAWTFNQVAGGTGSLRGYIFQMGGSNSLGISSSNTLTSYVAHTFNGGITLSGSDISIAGNKIKSTNILFKDGLTSVDALNNVGFQSLNTNSGTELATAPSGTNTHDEFSVFRTNDTNTNYQTLQIGSDIFATEFSVGVRQGGSAALLPLTFRMGSTAALGINIASPYVQFEESTTGAGSALLGGNSPAVTLSAPYDWIKVKCKDGSGTCYFPEWK